MTIIRKNLLVTPLPMRHAATSAPFPTHARARMHACVGYLDRAWDGSTLRATNLPSAYGIFRALMCMQP
jgi:hypothetical protein